jgi:hypothetical protein
MAAPPIVSFGSTTFDDGRWPVRPSLEFSPNSIRRSPFGTGAPHRQMGGCSCRHGMVHSPAKFDGPE